MPHPTPRTAAGSILARLHTAALLAAAITCAASTAPPAAAPQSSAAAGEARSARLRPVLSRADVRFMTAMLAHHREGLEMLEVAANRAHRPALRILVMRIRSNYEDESTMIRLWLRDRQESQTSTFDRLILLAEEHGTYGDLPGMLTPAQMEALRAASGEEFDHQFLRHAIRHHEAALELTDLLLTTSQGGYDETVARIVESVQGEQNAYVGHMRRMLRDASL